MGFLLFFTEMARKKRKSVTVGFVALGCPKNIVDSERMLARIAQANLVITAEADNADVVVINTCGFIAPAKAEALDAIKHAVSCKHRGVERNDPWSRDWCRKDGTFCNYDASCREDLVLYLVQCFTTTSPTIASAATQGSSKNTKQPTASTCSKD